MGLRPERHSRAPLFHVEFQEREPQIAQIGPTLHPITAVDTECKRQMGLWTYQTDSSATV